MAFENPNIPSLKGQLTQALRDHGQNQVDWLLRSWWKSMGPNLNNIPSETRPKLARLFEQFGSSERFSEEAKRILNPNWVVERMQVMDIRLVEGGLQTRVVSDHIRRADGRVDEFLFKDSDPSSPNGIELMRRYNFGPGCAGIEFSNRKYPPLSKS